MNSYLYEELYIGLTASFSVVITEEHLSVFQNLTGDINPLHSDKQYAQEKGYPSKIVFGMLTASYYSTLAGVYLPGERSLLHSVETKFLAPVFCGDKLTIFGTVADKSDTFKQITIKANIENQQGQMVSKATLKVGVI
ncbi:MaoC/PaaZ C-terminal domain-containing protein [Lysinibacillus fusiformis]|uniref:MaoC/PaaZ C-terminal domain-containing protein n=1 Tax=Lysinibacillus fusiformis TaxID=28031 RepID=UPI0037F34C53